MSIRTAWMTADDRSPTGVFVGTRDGGLFASADGGESWHTLADDLLGVRSVKIAYAG
jgi:hypothetical protein